MSGAGLAEASAAHAATSTATRAMLPERWKFCTTVSSFALTLICITRALMDEERAKHVAEAWYNNDGVHGDDELITLWVMGLVSFIMISPESSLIH